MLDFDDCVCVDMYEFVVGFVEFYVYWEVLCDVYLVY